MTSYEAYVFFLCLVVFTALSALFAVLIYNIIKLTVRLIRHGADDERIRTDYLKSKARSSKSKTVSTVISAVLCVFLSVLFAFSLWLHVTEDDFSPAVSVKVVGSSSMASKNKRNKYLFENRLDDQFNTFDLILTHEVPGEFDLRLYDVVVYEHEGVMIIHRIVGIEEPNAEHPGGREFTLQGDAISNPDALPVTYDQIRAIYHGERLPFAGSFVFFMQSPAGWLCILLMLFVIVATPIVEKKIGRETQRRLREIGVIDDGESACM